MASPRGGLGWTCPVFPEFDFLMSRNPLKKLWGGGLIFTHSEHSIPSLRTFISLIHSLIYLKFSGSLPHAGNNSILPGAHSKVKIINTNLCASMSDKRLEHSLFDFFMQKCPLLRKMLLDKTASPKFSK